jgi:hypothetical protein
MTTGLCLVHQRSKQSVLLHPLCYLGGGQARDRAAPRVVGARRRLPPFLDQRGPAANR